MSGLEIKKLALYQLGFTDLEVPDNWSATITYALGDRVAYNGVEYTSSSGSNLNNIPTSGAPWTAGKSLSQEALIVNEVYEEQSEYVAQEYNWNIFTKYATLSSPTTLSGEKYTYSYTLPTDWKRNYNVFQDVYRRIAITDFEIDEINKKLKCNTKTNIYIEYLYFDRDTFADELPINFKNYFKYVLAHNLCLNLVGDEKLEIKLIELAKRAKMQAYSQDTKNVKVRRITSCDRYNVLRVY